VFRKITPVGEIDERNFRYKYNEDEPRDEDGKWTDGGGSSGDSSGDGGDSGGGDAKVSKRVLNYLPGIMIHQLRLMMFVSPRPKVAAEAIDDVMKKLENTVPTSAPVDEGWFYPEDGTSHLNARHWLSRSGKTSLRRLKSRQRHSTREKPLLSVGAGRGGSGKSWLTKNKVADPVRLFISKKLVAQSSKKMTKNQTAKCYLIQIFEFDY